MKPRLVVLGGGGHARVILDIIAGEYDLAGFTSVEEDERTVSLFGCPRLGGDEVLGQLRQQGITHAFAAVGKNAIRRAVASRATELGFTLANAISAGALVSRRAALGGGVAVMPGAVINAGTEVGDGAIINTNASVDHDCQIGAFAHIAPGVAIAGSVKIGEEVLVGVGARIIPGVKIGNRAVIAAGAVVIRDVGADVLVTGVPATVKKLL